MPEHKVNVVLGLSSDSSRAAQDLDALQGKLEETDKALKDKAGGWRDELHDLTHKDGKFSPFKAVTEIGSAIGMAGGGIMKGVDLLTKSLQLLGDQSSTTAEKIDTLVKAIPGVGDLYSSGQQLGRTLFFMRSAQSLAEYQQTADAGAGYNAIWGSADNNTDAISRQIRQVSISSSRAGRRVSGLQGRMGGGGLLGGGLAMQTNPAILAAQEMIENARNNRRDALESNRNAELSLEDALQSKRRAEGALNNADMNRRAAGQGEIVHNAPQEMEAILRLTKARRDLTEATNQYQQRLQIAQQTSIELAQRENELGKANLELKKAKLSILEQEEAKLREQEARFKSGATQFGAMGHLEQMQLVRTLERAKEMGYGALTREERGILGGFSLTSNMVAEGAQNFAMNDSPVFQRLNALLGSDSIERIQKDIGEKVQQRIALSAEVKIESAQLEATLQKQISESFEFFAKQVVEAIKLNARETASQIFDDLRIKELQNK